MAAFPHDPDAVLDYYIDWTPWLAGDTITLSTWATPDSTVTLEDDAILDGFTGIWASVNGVPLLVVPLTNHITTAAGREEDRTIYLVMQEK